MGVIDFSQDDPDQPIEYIETNSVQSERETAVGQFSHFIMRAALCVSAYSSILAIFPSRQW
jgi:hypothetical protein